MLSPLFLILDQKILDTLILRILGDCQTLLDSLLVGTHIERLFPVGVPNARAWRICVRACSERPNL